MVFRKLNQNLFTFSSSNIQRSLLGIFHGQGSMGVICSISYAVCDIIWLIFLGVFSISPRGLFRSLPGRFYTLDHAVCWYCLNDNIQYSSYYMQPGRHRKALLTRSETRPKYKFSSLESRLESWLHTVWPMSTMLYGPYDMVKIK